MHSLQTLLLINHFSRSYCSLKEHDISQVSCLFQKRCSKLMKADFPLAIGLHDPPGWYTLAEVSSSGPVASKARS